MPHFEKLANLLNPGLWQMDIIHNEITCNLDQCQWVVKAPYLCSLSDKDLWIAWRDESISLFWGLSASHSEPQGLWK